MTESTIIPWVGGPGTGKTETLLEFLCSERDLHGILLDDIQFLSFSRAQIRDVKRRLINIYPSADEKTLAKHVRTIHGAALSSLLKSGALSLKSSSVDGGWKIIATGRRHSKPYQQFCNMYNLRYDPKMGNLFEGVTDQKYLRNLPEGNAFFAINNYLTAQMWSNSLWATAIHALGIRVDKRLLDASLFSKWGEFKKTRHLLEHEDYCKLALEMKLQLDGKVLLIDEFQDVSPSHYALFRMWHEGGTFERIYLAGDPNQSIYGFRGCNPDYLINISETYARTCEVTVPKSHRCPEGIVNFADTVLCNQSNMLPNREGGIVEWFSKIRTPYGSEVEAVTKYVCNLQQKHKKVMLLCRFQSQVLKWHNAFNKQGIPHLAISQKYHTWDWVKSNKTSHKQSIREILIALDSFERYIHGEKDQLIPISSAKTLIRLLDIDEQRKVATESYLNHISPDSSIFVRDLQNLIWVWYVDVRAFTELLITIPRSEQDLRRYLQAAVENDHLFDPSAILIDTIHSSKGLQAPAVVLDCSYLKDRVQDVTYDPTEERRIGYVGATRASEHLVLLEPLNGIWNPVFESARRINNELC